VGRAKLIAFVISAGPVGMCGAVYAYFLGQIFPQFAFNPLFDLSIALMSLFGGIGTLAGPLLGALLLESLQQYFTIQFSNGDLYLVMYGALFLAVLLWLPRGVLPTVGDFLRRAQKRRASGASGAVDVGPPGLAPGAEVAGALAIAGGDLVKSRREG
jgi:branched-chain amino acid transport system permease protein